MIQFRLSDLLFVTALAAVLGALHRLDLVANPWCYLDMWLLMGIAATITGVICLALGFDFLSNILLPAAPFWVAIQNVFLQMRAFEIMGCGPEPEWHSIQMAQEFWDQGEVGAVVVGVTLLATVWIAIKRRWNVPWLLVPSLVTCLVQVLLLNSGVWAIIRLGFGPRCLG
jgi:hypothetical protein